MGLIERCFGAGAAPQPPRGDPDQIAEVQRVLDELAPAVASDGGAIHLVSVEDGWVEVRLVGACAHCPASDTTVFLALEPKLRAAAPWVRGVRTV
jgi:Fe-S cluster biogenesis protein NfuA